MIEYGQPIFSPSSIGLAELERANEPRGELVLLGDHPERLLVVYQTQTVS